MTNEVRNSKFEIRGKSEIRSTTQKLRLPRQLTAVLRISYFEFVSDFVFRVSDLLRDSSLGFRIFLALLSLCVATGVIGCATEKKQKWLSFFFDGVPATGSPTNSAQIEYDENGKPLDKLVVAQPNQPAAPKQTFVAHPPYEDKKCNECHESRFSVKMKGPQTQVCFSCHDDFLSKLKVKHQPAENGECSSCHDPHGNLNPKMVLQTGQNLCALCHDPFPKAAKSKHQPVENGECLSCHNPHASNSKGLLLKPDGKLCFECHDTIEKQLTSAKVKHQPVENGECSSCHRPHTSDQKKLLSKPDGKLCFECHEDFEKSLAKAAFKHDPVGNNECASCHNPHQSNEKGLLIKERGKLCFECHEDKDIASVKGHEGQLQKSCVDCHDPHMEVDKFLLKAAAKGGGGK
jgi:predicted CXXCH cytochrome family protein